MNNALLDVSAKALQKSLEKGAILQHREEFGDLDVAAAEEAPSSPSIFQRLLHWTSSIKPSHVHVAAPKLKNKGI